MNVASKLRVEFGTAVLVAGVVLLLAAVAQARQLSVPQGDQSINQRQNEMDDLTDVQRQTGVDSKQKSAYKKFLNVNEEEPDKKIELGTEFLKKYPTSPFTEAIDAGLTNAYLAKQDWKDFYTYADKVLAQNPDEVDVLTTVGWVIPHQYDPNAPGAAQQLQTAETDEKHALDLLAKVPKPKGMSDQEFAATKAQKSRQAHSALGLIYFRQGDYTESASELQQSTQAGANQDPTDLFVLGVDLQNLNRHAEAAKAFGECSQIAGALQDRCKQSASDESHSAGGGH